MIESALRRSEVPEKELTRIITNMTSEGRPSRANVLKILAHFKKRADEVGAEARNLWNQLSLEGSEVLP